jgi:hypothetical protein
MAKMGRPKKEIDWVVLDKLCSIQCTEEEIAAVMDCSVDTICRAVKEKHGVTFAEYFAGKMNLGRVSLRRKIWDMGVNKGDIKALKLLCSNILGLNERQEFSGDISERITLSYDKIDDKN